MYIIIFLLLYVTQIILQKEKKEKIPLWLVK